MSQIKEAFVGSQRKYKIYITISIRFCSNISFIGKIFSRNWHLFLVLSFFNFKFNVCVLATVISGDKLVSVQPDISKIFFRNMSENNCSHKNVLLIIKHIWRNN